MQAGWHGRWLAAGVCGFVLAGAPARAQDAAQPPEEAPGHGGERLEEIVVSASPVQRESFTVPASVDVISGENKLRMQETSLGETLDALAGVTTIQTGSQTGKPVIRGLSGNRIRVLSNGIGLDFQQFGVRHAPNLDPYVAERIEVVRGASSILYGSDAIGGAVNVISADPPSTGRGETLFEGRATGEISTAFEQQTLALELDAAAGPWGITGTAVYRDSDKLKVPDGPTALETGDPSDPLATGGVPFSGFEQANGDVAVGYTGDWGLVALRWEGWRNEQNFPIPVPPAGAEDSFSVGGLGQDLENDIVQLSADVNLGGGNTLEPSFTWVRNLRVSGFGPPDPVPVSELGPGGTAIDVRRDSLIGKNLLKHGQLFGLLSGQVGVEVRYSTQSSRGPVALSPGGTVENYAVFLFEEMAFGPLTLNIGGRLDRREIEADPAETFDDSGLPGFSDDPRVPDDPALLEQDYTVANGSFGASYQFTDNLVLAANVASSFRAPTLFDLFVNGVHGGVAAVQLGEPRLEEERALSTDLALRYRSPRLDFTATVYRNDVSDFIFPAGTGETDAASGLPVFQIMQDDAEIYGANIEATWRPVAWLDISATYEEVESSLSAAGTSVPLTPADKLSGEVRLHRESLGPLEQPYFTVSVRHADDKASAGLIEPFGQFDGPPPPFGTASTDSYTVVGLATGWRFDQLRLGLSVDNLFDEEHRDFLDTLKNITLGPGRDIQLSLSLDF